MSFRLVPLLLIGGSLAGCASNGYRGLAPDASGVSVQSELPAPDPTRPGTAQFVHRLGPNDAISIRIFGIDAFSREITIDSSGAITVPLIGAVQASGLTTGELGAAIADRLRGRYLRDPQVSIDIREIRSRLMTIDGAVNQPGIYPLVGDMSLMRAIATARGASEFAHLDRVAVFRTVDNQRMAAMFSLRGIREGRYPDPVIYPNDVIMVGENGSRRFWRDLVQLLPGLGIFTPLLATPLAR